MPFWKGDGIGRPLEFGRAIGAFTRELDAIAEPRGGRDRAAANATTTSTTLAAQQPARLPRRGEGGDGRSADRPHDRRRALPRRTRRLADGDPDAVRRAGARAVGAGDRGRPGGAQRLRRADDLERRRHRHPLRGWRRTSRRRRCCSRPRTRSRSWSSNRLADTALFASHFRENAGRALLLPEAPAGRALAALACSGSARRTCSRWRAATGRSRSSSRPTANACGTCSTCRASRRCSAQVQQPRDSRRRRSRRRRRRRSRARCCSTTSPPTCTRAMRPLAERRAQALTLDRNLLRDLLGEARTARTARPGALSTASNWSCSALVEGRKARNADQVHDLLRRLGDLTEDEVAARLVDAGAGRGVAGANWRRATGPAACASAARSAGSRSKTRAASATRWASRRRSACRRCSCSRRSSALGGPAGAVSPVRMGRSWRRSAARALGDPGRRLSARRSAPRGARHRGARRLPPRRRPSASGATPTCCVSCGGGRWRGCGAMSSRSTARRSRASWRVAGRRQLGAAGSTAARGPRAARRRARSPPPCSSATCSPAGSRTTSPRWLDELGAAGEIAWAGARRAWPRRRPHRDCRGATAWTVLAAARALEPEDDLCSAPSSTRPAAARSVFFRDLVAEARRPPRDVLEALWELVWAGLVTNDTFAPLRALAHPNGTQPRRGHAEAAARSRRRRPDAGGRCCRTVEPQRPGPTARAHALANRAARTLRRGHARGRGCRRHRRAASRRSTRC